MIAVAHRAVARITAPIKSSGGACSASAASTLPGWRRSALGVADGSGDPEAAQDPVRCDVAAAETAIAARSMRDQAQQFTVGFRFIAGARNWPSLPGSSLAGRCPTTTAAPSTALATIQPAFTDAE